MKLSEFKKIIKEEYGSEAWEKIENSYIYTLNTATEEKQLEAIKKRGVNIQYINNPSEKLQLVAVKQDGYAIQFIHNPSEKVQLEAVRQTRYAITDTNSPTDKVIKEVIKKTPINDFYEFLYLLRYIENDLKED